MYQQLSEIQAAEILKSFPIEQWPDIFEALNYPEQDAFSFVLWRLCSGGELPYDTASEFYRKCGYIPFSGFPLARSGRFNRLNREQTEAILDKLYSVLV